MIFVNSTEEIATNKLNKVIDKIEAGKKLTEADVKGLS